MARQIAIWFHRSYGGKPAFKPEPFVVPPNPSKASEELASELARLRQESAEQVAKAADAHLTASELLAERARLEKTSNQAFADLHAALTLAEESEARLAQEREQFQQQILALQAQVTAKPVDIVQSLLAKATKAASLLDLDESATRRLIDQQLRDIGWEADTDTLTFQKGVRPQKGKNLAIAEWPTENGPADYVLFAGLTPLAAVEAKKANKDVPASIEQAKRYSREYIPSSDESLIGPWADFKLPFCFATNGRPFLRQIQTKSGVWFLDARKSTNLSRPLESWYSPAGLSELLAQDTATADKTLAEESADLLPLRNYQKLAIKAVERGLLEGMRELLVAMATGTGKTRTCIGLIYRLIKAGRFRRILFLVDRTSLGIQTQDALKDIKLDAHLAFTDIYDVKELGDIAPDADTKLQISTVQGMVKRLLFPSADSVMLPVDAYDCIVVDECHRGYSLDKDLSDTELTFRDEADYVGKYRRVLDHFDAVKIGLTATPALHTVEIFGRPIYSYSYRQAVIDGWLVEHEPPIRIVTELAEDGITWKRGETMQMLLPFTGEIDSVAAPDEVKVEIDEFNKRVLTENFNRVICTELAKQIDPSLPGKTIIFCATDNHADLVVDLLKQAFAEQYGTVEDDAVRKITSAADKPLNAIRALKNERLPNVAVTVDLLSTGIDVPAVTNLVFLRRVRSRILYEQMLGRATRLCDEIGKERFLIFDAVDVYKALEPYSSMKPVVVQPRISFAQLSAELKVATTESVKNELHSQFVAKLQRKKRLFTGSNADAVETLTGLKPEAFVQKVRSMTPSELKSYLSERPSVAVLLDRVGNPDPSKVLISEHNDNLRRLERGYGTAKKPEDFLESFRKFVNENIDTLPALLIVTQRPRELTRQQLRELKLALDAAGFSEASLQTAYRETTNQDIAATIIGYVRHIVAGQPLLPYRERVQKAVSHILKARPWTTPQRKWLERIGKQLEVETIVDHDALDHGQFQAEGGFGRLNKIFDGKLDEVLGEMTDAIWTAA